MRYLNCNRAIQKYQNIPDAVKSDIEVSLLYASIFMGVVSPLFLLGSFSLYVICFSRVEHELGKIFYPAKWWFFAIPISTLLLMYLTVSPFPQGDMLRDLVAHYFDFDYSKMYPDSPLLPTHDLWIGFDWLVGFVERELGPVTAAYLVSGAVSLIVFSTTLIAIRFPLRHHPDQWFWLTLLLGIVLLSLYTSRITSGRPELIATAWFLSAVFLRPWIWVMLGLALAPLYWLWPMYSVASLLLRGSIGCKLFSGIVAGGGSIAIWYLHTQGAWLDSLLLVQSWMQLNLSSSAELKSPISALLSLPVLGSAILIVYCFRHNSNLADKREAAWILLVIGIVLVPNFLRYAPIVIVLLVVALATLIRSQFRLKVNGGMRLILFVSLPLTFASLYMGSWKQSQSIPDFNLPPGSYLFAQNDQAQFVTILKNRGLMSAPALEISASDKAIQDLVKESVLNGRLECDVLHRFGFTHALESSLTKIPDCLELIDVHGRWRLWEVKE